VARMRDAAPLRFPRWMGKSAGPGGEGGLCASPWRLCRRASPPPTDLTEPERCWWAAKQWWPSSGDAVEGTDPAGHERARLVMTFLNRLVLPRNRLGWDQINLNAF